MELDPMPSVLIDRTLDEENLEQPAMATSDVDGTLEQPIPALSDNACDVDEAESDDSSYSFDDEDENDTSSASSEEELFPTLGNCRICHAPELDEASDTGSIIGVGCGCKGDLNSGHELCLKRWFVPQLLKTGKMPVCEHCRGDLGAELKQIILTRDDTEERALPEVEPQVLFLLQVPPEDLDRLQVPIDTPEFSALPPHTQSAIDQLLRTLEDEQYHEQIRRGEIQETAMFRAAHGVGADRGDRALPRSRWSRASQLLRHHFIVMQHVTVRMENAGQPVHAFIPRNAGPVGADMNIRILMEELRPPLETLDPEELPLRGEVLRVAMEQGQGGQTPDVEVLLDELAVHADLVARNDPWSMILLPRSIVVENIFINGAPNNIAGGIPVPLAQQRACLGRRQFTYGRYRRQYLFRFEIIEYGVVDFDRIFGSDSD